MLYVIVKARSALSAISRKLPVAGWEHKDFVGLLNGIFYIVTALVRTDVFRSVILFCNVYDNFFQSPELILI